MTEWPAGWRPPAVARTSWTVRWSGHAPNWPACKPGTTAKPTSQQRLRPHQPAREVNHGQHARQMLSPHRHQSLSRA